MGDDSTLGAVIGGSVAAGVVCIVLAVVGLCCFVRWRGERNENRKASAPSNENTAARR